MLIWDLAIFFCPAALGLCADEELCKPHFLFILSSELQEVLEKKQFLY